MPAQRTDRDGLEITDMSTGKIVHSVPCTYDSERARERVLIGLLLNLRDDCFIRDTRDVER